VPISLFSLPDCFARFMMFGLAQVTRRSTAFSLLTLAVCLVLTFQRAHAQDRSAVEQIEATQLTENGDGGSSPAHPAFSVQAPVVWLHPDSSSPLDFSQESTSQESTSQESTSQESTSQESTSQESTSQEPTSQESTRESVHEKPPVESELITEGEGSFGHYHIFAYSWWSELYTGGIEYDRHSWNYFLKSQMDWVAEVLPVSILRQPSDTDVFGDPLSQARYINPGLGIYPVGLRMKWRYDKGWQPYFIVKGGMLFFAHKALSKDAARQNFSLQTGLGMQRRLTRRVDMRVGYEDIHFSDAFMVPSNPGLDVMAYDGGIVYHLGK
jgi:opacity protein-like surface antigen